MTPLDSIHQIASLLLQPDTIPFTWIWPFWKHRFHLRSAKNTKLYSVPRKQKTLWSKAPIPQRKTPKFRWWVPYGSLLLPWCCSPINHYKPGNHEVVQGLLAHLQSALDLLQLLEDVAWRTPSPKTAWWFERHPSEKNKFVNWDDEIPNNHGTIKFMSTKPPTRKLLSEKLAKWNPITIFFATTSIAKLHGLYGTALVIVRQLGWVLSSHVQPRTRLRAGSQHFTVPPMMSASLWQLGEVTKFDAYHILQPSYHYSVRVKSYSSPSLMPFAAQIKPPCVKKNTSSTAYMHPSPQHLPTC